MEGLGEHDIDLNFEDLDFTVEEIDGLTEDPNADEEGADPNEEGAATEEGSEGSDEEGGTEGTTEEEGNNDDAADGEGQENVGGSTEEGDDEQSSPQLYASLASTLVEEGVLSSVEESSLKDVKDIDGFVDLMKEQIKAQELKDLTDTQKEVLTGMREGVTVDTATKFKDAMAKLDVIDDDMVSSNIEVRKDLIYQDFLAKGFSKEKAIKQVERSIKLEVDLEDAKEALGSLKSVVKSRYEQAKADDISSKEANEASLEKENAKIKKGILEGDEPFVGVKTPKNIRKEVYKEMTDFISVNPDTKESENSLMKYKRENPTEYTQQLYYLWKVTNGFKDVEYFKGKAKTSSVKDLERALKTSTHVQGGGSPSYSDDGNTGFLDMEDIVFPE